MNTPGSTKGCVEQLDAVIDVLPHALRLLHDADTPTDRARNHPPDPFA